MSSKIRDITEGPQEPDFKPQKKQKKRIYSFKSNEPVTPKMEDIQHDDHHQQHFLKKYHLKAPKKIADLLKLAIFGFLIIFIINLISVYGTAINLKAQLTEQAKEGVDNLITAAKQSSNIGYQSATASFTEAEELFKTAEDSLWFISHDNSIYKQDSDISYAISSIISAAKDFTQAGQNLFAAIEEFNRIPIYFVTRNSRPDAKAPSLSAVIEKGLAQTDLAITQISDAANQLSEININVLPPNFQERFLTLQGYLDQTNQTLTDISQYFPSLLRLLGDRYPHRIMVLFQNNFELRPTGGFIGSYATFDLNDGYIENLEVHDVYDIDGSFGGYIEPPAVMGDFTNNWRFRDSNYSPDFPTSAKKILWIYEKEGGESIDTLVAINQGLLKDLLEITGPIQVGEFGQLKADNYNLLLSYIIEGKIWGSENPKHILKLFVPAMKDALLTEQNLSKVIPKIYNAIQQKHIFVYSKHEDLQDLFTYLNLDGTLHQPKADEDFLAVIHTGIGTKTDQFIEETIDHRTEISESQEVINTLTIHRNHQWSMDVYWQWETVLRQYGLSLSNITPSVLSILGNGVNTSNLRIYVPKNTELITSSDQSVQLLYDEELDLAYFSAKMVAKAGETTDLKIIYKPNLDSSLNSDSFATYKAYIAKQPGTAGSLLNKTIVPPENYQPIQYYPSDLKATSTGTLKINSNLVYDRYYSTIFEK